MSSPSLVLTQSHSHVKTHLRLSPPLILLVLTLLTRWPLQSRELYHWDSVNFAFAIRKFDVALGQPHAPGYLLYVLLGRVATALTGSAQSGYVLLAILGTALSAWALYDLGRRLWNPRVGWLAALFLLTSPLFWFYGEVALPHTLDALMVIVGATLCWRVRRGEKHLATGLALWLGLSGALREQTLVFLLPLAVAACWKLPWRLILSSVAILVVSTLAWLLPLLSMTGGAANYFKIVGAYSASFDRPTSIFLGAGWAGLHHNLSKLIRYTLWAWAFGLVPVALAAKALLQPPGTPLLRNPRFWLLALWAAPSLFFYVFIHMGQQGLIFVYFPICMLLSARAADALIRQWRGGSVLVAGCLAVNTLLYLFCPVYLLPGGRLKVLSEATLRQQDALIEAEIKAIRADFPPGGVLLSNSWRFPQYYLPEIPLVPFNPTTTDDAGPATPISPELQKKVMAASALTWYEPVLDVSNKAPGQTKMADDYDGVRLRILRRTPQERFWITPHTFGVAPVK